MIYLEQLEAQSAILVRNGCGESCVTSCDDVLELITRLRQAEKDAARYRWLRDKAHTVTGLTQCAFVMKDGELMEDWNGQYGLLCMGALDLAVDEAILENQTRIPHRMRRPTRRLLSAGSWLHRPVDG